MDRRTLFPAAIGMWAATASALNAAPPAPRRAYPAPRRMEVAAADGTPLAYTDWGRGPTVLLLHAWALSTRMWDAQIAGLTAAGVRCVAFDRRGHGRSPDPGRGYDLDTLSDDVDAVMEQLDLRDVTLVGHSMGGAEAVRYLGRANRPRVARLVLLAPVTPCLVRSPDNPNGLPAAAFEQVRSAWVRDFPKWVADNTAAFYTPQTSPETMAQGARMLLETPLPVALACSRATTAADLRPDCARIRVPTRILHGDADASAPLGLTGRPTAAFIPGAKLDVIEGAPHGLFTTHAQRVNAAILEAVRST